MPSTYNQKSRLAVIRGAQCTSSAVLLLHQRKDAESTLPVITENTVFGRIVSLEQLISLFDVNRAEGELARLSTLGNTLKKIAALRRVQRATARSHSSKVLSETSMRNQSALLRLIGLVPAMR